MPRRCIILAVLVLALLGLHLFPPHRGSEPMVLGFVPWDLAYALLWMLGAAAVVLYMTERVWKDDR